jgi:DNA mismatch repair protein MutS2
MTNEHALRLLQFERVREDAAGYALSEEGREAMLAELPREESGEVSAIKAAVGELVGRFQEGETAPELSFPSIATAMRRLAKEGSSLELPELYALGLWAESFASFAAFMAKGPGARRRSASAPARASEPPPPPAGAAGEEEAEGRRWSEGGGPLVDALLADLPDLAAVSRIAFRIVNKDGTLRDLPELRAAQERIARAHREIAAITESFFKNPETRGYLQSNEPTVRDGRTVLALRSNFRGRVRGIVHEVSATGQTVFVEPEELVQKNNELVQEEARYLQELARILREATEKLFAEGPALARARRIMVGLDGVYARARHARVSGYFLARDLPSGFVIKKARHPLLGSRAVPIDVELPEGTRTLIVTGPNTGGKTVTLKTIGLLALMNQFGLAIPAALESGFAVFDSVYADIGDEQSIDQSLSTFSGHMRVIGGIADRAGPKSLVLLDELGSGTDPEEGCAVAMGLLDWFIERGCLTVLTTHHGILKNYGYTRPGCLNASMDFDAASLQPTYRVLMGVPGESRALDVASQNGIRPAIIEGARKYLAEERTDVSVLIKGLTEKHRALDSLETERLSRLKDAREEQRKADLARLKLKQRELELREEGVGELRRLLSESRKTLENLVKAIREGELTPEKTKEMKDFLAAFAGEVEAEEGRLDAARAESSEAQSSARRAGEKGAGGLPEHLGEGCPVMVGSSRKRGLVIRKAKKGYWLVETDSLRITVPESELSIVAPLEAPKPQVAVELAPRGEGGRTTAVFELDVRGMRLVEALEAVEKQLDAASIQGLNLFSIIHGTGEGVLGKGIQEYLKKQAAVGDYYFARPEEGGYGKTIVHLK